MSFVKKVGIYFFLGICIVTGTVMASSGSAAQMPDQFLSDHQDLSWHHVHWQALQSNLKRAQSYWQSSPQLRKSAVVASELGLVTWFQNGDAAPTLWDFFLGFGQADNGASEIRNLIQFLKMRSAATIYGLLEKSDYWQKLPMKSKAGYMVGALSSGLGFLFVDSACKQQCTEIYGNCISAGTGYGELLAMVGLQIGYELLQQKINQKTSATPEIIEDVSPRHPDESRVMEGTPSSDDSQNVCRKFLRCSPRSLDNTKYIVAELLVATAFNNPFLAPDVQNPLYTALLGGKFGVAQQATVKGLRFFTKMHAASALFDVLKESDTWKNGSQKKKAALFVANYTAVILTALAEARTIQCPNSDCLAPGLATILSITNLKILLDLIEQNLEDVVVPEKTVAALEQLQKVVVEPTPAQGKESAPAQA